MIVETWVSKRVPPIGRIKVSKTLWTEPWVMIVPHSYKGERVVYSRQYYKTWKEAFDTAMKIQDIALFAKTSIKVRKW